MTSFVSFQFCRFYNYIKPQVQNPTAQMHGIAICALTGFACVNPLIAIGLGVAYAGAIAWNPARKVKIPAKKEEKPSESTLRPQSEVLEEKYPTFIVDNRKYEPFKRTRFRDLLGNTMPKYPSPGANHPQLPPASVLELRKAPPKDAPLFPMTSSVMKPSPSPVPNRMGPPASKPMGSPNFNPMGPPAPKPVLMEDDDNLNLSKKPAHKRKREPSLKRKKEPEKKRNSLSLESQEAPIDLQPKPISASSSSASLKSPLPSPAEVNRMRNALFASSYAVAIAINLEIDLFTAIPAQINYVYKLAMVVEKLRNSPDEFKKFKSPIKNNFVPKNITGLSRDLQFDLNGERWVYLDQEGLGDQILGEGSYKKVSQALNLKTLEVFALSKFKVQSEWTGIEMSSTQLFQGDIEGLAATHSWISYMENGELVTAFIQKKYPYKLDKEMSSFNIGDKFQVAIDVLTGLKSIHELGFCHFDIKPENIQFERKPDGKIKAVLNDFNFVTPNNQLINRRGTPKYIAPEMRNGCKASTSMDMYSLGKTILELFQSGPIPGVEVLTLIEKMMDKDPEKRPSASKVLEVLKIQMSRWRGVLWN